MLELDKDNFVPEVEQRPVPVVIDFWGPQCGPCLALMPEIEKLAESYGRKVKFCKVNVTGNRRLCIQLKIMSVPAFLFYKGGECQNRIAGEEVSINSIKENTEALLG